MEQTRTEKWKISSMLCFYLMESMKGIVVLKPSFLQKCLVLCTKVVLNSYINWRCLLQNVMNNLCIVQCVIKMLNSIIPPAVFHCIEERLWNHFLWCIAFSCQNMPLLHHPMYLSSKFIKYKRALKENAGFCINTMLIYSVSWQKMKSSSCLPKNHSVNRFHSASS